MTDSYTEFNSMFQAPYSRHSELFSNYRGAMSWDQRLREALADKGWSKKELSRRSGVAYDNVNKYVAGEVKQPRGDQLDKLADALEVDRLYLSTGRNPLTGEVEIPVMGYVGAGGDVDPDYEQIPPEGLKQVTIPFPLPDDMVAFEVTGTSMLPQFRAGTLIIVFKEQRRSTESFYGEEAVVRTTDGRRYIKTIMRGQRGVTLTSWNAEPVEDVHLAWIGEIFTIMPPGAARRIIKQGGVQGQLHLKAS